MLAAYTLGDVLWTLTVFLIWLALLGVGIWLLIRLFRNKNFIPGHRGWRITVKVLLVIFTVFVPILGVIVLFVIWHSTESTSAAKLEATPTSSADRAPSGQRLPFPPPSARKDTP